MTRKHFEAIAKALKERKADLYICEAIAHECGVFNPAFDRAKFLKACGH